MFETAYRDHKRFNSAVGDRFVMEYSPVYDENGRLELKESGKTDLYEYIQSHRDSVDIHVLLKRYQLGDAAALSKVQGVYGDFTEAPKSFADMLNLVNAGRQYFDSLPVEVKQQFNNNFAEFMADYGSQEFFDRISKGSNIPVEPKNVKEKTDES